MLINTALTPMNRFLALSVAILLTTVATGQDTQNTQAPAPNNNVGSRFSGAFDAFGNFFMRDTTIGAFNIPQYDRQLVGADAWLSLNYSHDGLEAGIRFDLFNNSNLLVPTQSYSAQGIGRWFIKKKIDKLTISGGYLYDQIGSGIIFRSYEERALAIDNALFGVSAKYALTPNWTVKAMTGKQKRQFELYAPIIRAASIDGFQAFGPEGKINIRPGAGITHRTIDDETMTQIVAQLNTYTPRDSIGARYNTFASTVYNTLTVGPVTWYAEAAFKTPEVMFDANAERLNWNGETSIGRLVNKPGKVLYSSLQFAAPGLGISAEYKLTDHFNFRVDPFF
jgi:hypothetical protein